MQRNFHSSVESQLDLSHFLAFVNRVAMNRTAYEFVEKDVESSGFVPNSRKGNWS